jgi:benzoate/toluate 1,2-dioxygenase subunit beta
MTDNLREIEQFLYREARLLDEQRFDDWFALFTSDAIYWLPAGRDDIDSTQHVSLIYDTPKEIARRIARLKSGYAYAQDPPSRIHRIVSNIELKEAENGSDDLIVSSVMVLIELTRRKQTIHSARCEFSLKRDGSDWKISRKKVNLLKNNEALDGIPNLV